MNTKFCTGCNQDLDLECFALASKSKDGRYYRCRKCESEKYKNSRRNNTFDKEKQRWSHIKNTFGLTSEDYERMFAAQNGVCAICKQPETKLSNLGTPINLAVDHCHSSGTIRGLLCRDCNVGLGQFGDNPQRLSVAANYLRDGGLAPIAN